MGCEAAKKPASSAAPQQAPSLDGKQWTLEEIGGKPVFENSKATLAFLQAD
jgi:heat shock protein HslJ